MSFFRFLRSFFPSSRRYYLLNAPFLQVFNLPGKIPIGMKQKKLVEAWDVEILDERFFNLTFFWDYAPVLRHYLENSQETDIAFFQLFERKLGSLQQALLAEEKNRYDLAREQYEKIIKIDPQDAFSHYQIGKNWILSGRVEDALPHLKIAVRCCPNFYMALLDLAYTYMETGEIELARDTHHRILELFPDDSNALEGLQKTGELVAAYDTTEQLEVKPFLQRAEQKRMLEEDLVRNWESLDFVVSIGRTALEEEFFTLARRCFERACVMEESPEFYYYVGVAALEEGKLNDALTIFMQILEEQPANSRIYFAMADVYYRRDEFDKARRYLQECLNLGEYTHDSIELMFLIMQENDNDDIALAWLVEFAEQQPNLAFPHHIAALYHHGKGDMESAVTFMQEALTRSPNEESLYGDMAMLLGITGRFEEIINLLKGRFEKDELQPIHLWNLALAYRDLDKSQEAIEIFTRFLDMDISEEYKKMALREVERLSELKKPH